MASIKKLFIAVKMSNLGSANEVIEDAKKELAIAYSIKDIKTKGRNSLKMIDEIIVAVLNGDMRDAKSKYTEAEKGFSGHVIGHLELLRIFDRKQERKLKEIREVQGLPNGNLKSANRKSEETQKGQRSRDSFENVDHSIDTRKGRPIKDKTELKPNENDDKVQELRRLEQQENKVSSHDNMFDQRASSKSNDGSFEKSKRASLKMRQNNPDIADLSDPNRPTKIAEKFSELYDNEWTEAFEELSKKSRTEEESIKILLEVVTEAYKFCKEVAEKQTKSIMKTWNAIFEFGHVDYKKESQKSSSGNDNEGESLIVQYRKKIASLALPKLKKDFSEEKMKPSKKKTNLPTKLTAFDLYIDKAVELTWWMCVQDPPIFLCPPTESEEFDKNLYRAYTKSGTAPRFFVWPALRLHKNGGVLMKGVVQFR